MRRASCRLGCSGLAALALLGGCASGPDVQMLATGRADVSAYALNGSDLETLRLEARRLCPLGGEVVRQSSQGTQLPAPTDSRWQRALQTTALWLDPPQRVAQLVIVCRQAGDRHRLAPALGDPPAERAQVAKPVNTPELSVALPVGPVMPEW